MSAPQPQYRESLDELEDGRGESAPLLGGEGSQANAENGQTWTQYPAQWWVQSKEYVSSMRKKHLDRGKQRQQDASRSESTDETVRNSSGIKAKLLRYRSEHPTAFIVLTALSGLFLFVLVLFLIVLFHLLFVTLRNPDDATQQRIMANSFSIDGPDNVRVVGLADNGLTINIQGRIGIDPDVALNEWLGERKDVSWWKRKDRDIVEWAVNKVAGVQVDVDTLALRSPDWSVKRDVDRVNLIPDDDKKKKKKYHASISKKQILPPTPADLVTFKIDPLLIPVPQVGKSDHIKGQSAPAADTPIDITLVIKPSGPALLEFARYTLENKTAYVDIKVTKARVRGLNFKDWARGQVTSSSWWGIPGWINMNVAESWKRLAQEVPKFDGNDTNTDEFLNLTRYDFAELGGPGSPYPERALGLDAYAEATNPLGKLLKGHVPYSLPFGAYLPVKTSTNASSILEKSDDDFVLLAAVATEPFDIDGQKKIPLKLHGRVIPPPQPPSFGRRSQMPMNAEADKAPSSPPKEDPAGQALGDFLSRFLRGDPNTLIVRGGSPFATPKMNKPKEGEMLPMPGGGSDDLPVWLDRLLRTMSVPISFPGSPVTDLIQNVTIADLKITPHPFGEDKFTCSGTIMGVMNMPGQLATVDVQITDLWPDVLIFNGKPPSMKHGGDKDGDHKNSKSLSKRDKKDGDDDDNDDDDDDTPIPDPLPDPLPEHAFGRVVPHKWAPAETYIDPEDPKGERKLLRSELKDVPFTLLPGRRSDFQSFSWKIITGEGAVAGVDGKSKAKIWNSGLGKLMLSNLPVQGVFTVGKRGSGGDDGDGDGDDGCEMAQC